MTRFSFAFGAILLVATMVGCSRNDLGQAPTAGGGSESTTSSGVSAAASPSATLSTTPPAGLSAASSAGPSNAQAGAPTASPTVPRSPPRRARPRDPSSPPPRGELLAFLPLADPPEHADRVFSVVYADEGRRIVSVGGDRRMKIVDAATGEQQHDLELKDDDVGYSFVHLAAARKGPLLALGAKSGVAIFDTSTGRRIADSQLKGERSQRGLWFAPKGDILLVVGQEAAYVVGIDGKMLRTWPIASGGRCAFSPDGRTLVCPGPNNTLDLFDVESGKPSGHHEGLKRAPDDMAFHPDGSLLALCEDDNIVVYELKTWNKRATFSALAARRVEFSPAGTIFSGSGSIKGYSLGRLEEPASAKFPLKGYIEGDVAVFSPDGVSMLALKGGRSTSPAV